MMRISLILLCFFFSSFSDLCFSQEITGRIEGWVVNNTGVPISSVNIVLRSENLQGTRGTTTDNKGYFHLLALPIGLYKVKFSSVGYGEITICNVQVNIDKTTNLGEIQLQTREYNLPAVIVSGEKYFIDPASTTYGDNIINNDFERLPVDRNYRSMVTLLPQANLSYYGDEANIGGATGFENKYFVDGVEVTDPLIGASGTKLPYNFIREIEVKAGGYNADSRSSLGGLLNVVTNSGTNKFHGSFFGFFTNNQLTGNRKLGPLDVTQGDFSNYDAGFALGGPIIFDKLWFYAAYNPTFNGRDVEVPSFGNSIDKTLTHSFAIKLNWRASDNLQFAFTTTGDPTIRDAVGRNILIPPSTLTNPDPYLQNIIEGGVNYSINGTYTIGDNILLEGLFASVNRHDSGEPATEAGKFDVLYYDFITNTASGGVFGTWDSFRYSNMGRITGTALLDNHIFNAGIEYKTNITNNKYDNHIIYKFLYDNSILYGEMIGKGFGKVSNKIPAIYIQDNWRINRNLNINAGVRWEGQYITGSNNKVVQTISVPLQPRIGFIFLPDEKGMQRIFGSFGRFSQEFALFQSVNYHSGNGYDYEIYFDHDPRTNNSVGDTSYSSLHTIISEVAGLKGQYYDEFNLGYERLLGWNIRAGIQAVYRSLREAIDDVWLTSENRLQFGNPGSGILSAWPKAQRNYSALVLTIERSGDEHFNFIASYVLSRNYGNYEGLFDSFNHGEFPNNNLTFNDLSYSRINTSGVLPNDRTHVFKFAGYYSFPFGLTTGITFIAQSGTPLSDYAIDLNNTFMEYLSRRGSLGRTPAIWDISMRLMYDLPVLSSWKSKIILDVFHIASQRKPVDIDQRHYLAFDENGNPIALNPTFMQAYRYQLSMSVRLGMEVSF